VKQATDLHTDQLAQASLAEFIRRGHMARHLVKMKTVYRSRLDAMESALGKFMPEESNWTRPEGGMSVWLSLPAGFDAGELLIHARERGVMYVPGRYFYHQNPHPNTLRLGFASLDEKRIFCSQTSACVNFGPRGTQTQTKTAHTKVCAT